MTEVEDIEMAAAIWHAEARPGGGLNLLAMLTAEYTGFMDGLNGRPWRKKPPRGEFYQRMWNRKAWEAGALAREMEGTR